MASDKDGDGVTFGFVGGTTTSGLFRIEENTGNYILRWYLDIQPLIFLMALALVQLNNVNWLFSGVIRLINGDINLDRDKYELNVTAMDDGRCCCENGKCPDLR